jgi:hypothetical protein
VVRQLAETPARDHDEDGSADVGHEVKGEEDDELDDLFQAPWLVLGTGGGLSEHAHRVRRIVEEDALRGNEVGVAVVDQGGLRKGGLARAGPGMAQSMWRTDIKNIDTALVYKETLEQALDNDQPLAKDQEGGVDQSSGAALEDEQEQKLG